MEKILPFFVPRLKVGAVQVVIKDEPENIGETWSEQLTFCFGKMVQWFKQIPFLFGSYKKEESGYRWLVTSIGACIDKDHSDNIVITVSTKDLNMSPDNVKHLDMAKQRETKKKFHIKEEE